MECAASMIYFDNNITGIPTVFAMPSHCRLSRALSGVALQIPVVNFIMNQLFGQNAAIKS